MSGGSGNCEVVVTGHSECSFVATLECWLEGYPVEFPIQIHGSVKVCTGMGLHQFEKKNYCPLGNLM